MNKQKHFIIFILAYCFVHTVEGQIAVTISHETSHSTTGVACVKLSVEHFENVAGFQFSMQWEAAFLQFDSLRNFGLPDLNENSFGTQNTDNGALAVVWNDPLFEGQSLPDMSVIFEVCFTATGNVGDVFEVNFSDTPTPVVFVQIEDGNLVESVPEQENGSVTIGMSLVITSELIEHVSCFGASDGRITLNVEGGTAPYSYLWSPSLMDTNIVANLSSGLYELSVTDSEGETFTASFEVLQPDSPLTIDQINIPDLTCINPTGTVNMTATGGTSPYSFDLNNTSSTNGNFENVAAGQYTFIITDNNNCSFTDSIEVLAPILPMVEIEGDTTSCDSPVKLTATGDEGIYQWFLDGASLNEDEDIIHVLSGGTYTVEVTNEDGCMNTASHFVFFATPIELMLDATDFDICLEDSVSLIPSGASHYTWIEEDLLTVKNNQTALFQPRDSGLFVFNVIGKDEYDCFTDSASIEILVIEPLGYTAADTCVQVGTEVELTAFEGLEYHWLPNEFNLSDSTIANPVSTPLFNSVYTVIIEDMNTCLKTDSIVVTVIQNPISSLPAINFITPNGDGENDVLDFGNLEKFTQNSLVVFNRWGNEVYNKLSYKNDWDGTYKGKKLPTGTYYYILSIGEEQLKSILTIINE